MTNTEKLIQAARARFRFGIARRIITASGGPSGRSWEEIFEKFDEDEDTLRLIKEDQLKSSLVEALLHNDKLVTFYEIDPDSLSGIHKRVDSIGNNIPDHPMAKAFPLPLAERTLSGMPLNQAIPVQKLEIDGATALLFCTNRLIERREEIDERQLSPMIASQYEKIIGMKRSFVQSYNAVIVPYSGNIARVYTEDSQLVTPTSAALDQITMRNAFNEAVEANFLRSPVNLFHAIRNLYSTPDEGDVVMLSHTVANGIKHERMKRGRCVRKERFHRGGADAVHGDLTPYQIAVRWVIEGVYGRTTPELRLLGGFRQTYEANPSLTEAVISGCATYDEFEHVVHRLLSHR